jgi:type II secretory pathway pseudopilin PulG
VGVIAATVAVAYIGRAVLARHFGSSAGDMSFDGIVAGAMAMAVFGALLGPDRPLWPWSLAPPAILLSMGPSLALVVGPERSMDWSQFGVVLPLFVVGVVASAWRPVALWLTSLGDNVPDQHDVGIETRSSSAVTSKRIRPTVVLNALAAGLLAVSLVVFRADPAPAQRSTAVPTYLGARNVVMDVRTKLDLRTAITVMDAYRADHGSYAGFDATAGRAADPSLSWTDGLPPEAAVFGDDAPDVAIVSATTQQARVVGLSGSGTAFCVQRSGGGLSFGSGVTPASAPPSGVTALHRAVAACGSTPWSPDAVRRFPIAGMCDGLDPTGGYLFCRVLQALMTDAMRPGEQ